jgi:hypothetical protein
MLTPLYDKKQTECRISGRHHKGRFGVLFNWSVLAEMEAASAYRKAASQLVINQGNVVQICTLPARAYA